HTFSLIPRAEACERIGWDHPRSSGALFEREADERARDGRALDAGEALGEELGEGRREALSEPEIVAVAQEQGGAREGHRRKAHRRERLFAPALDAAVEDGRARVRAHRAHREEAARTRRSR